MKHSEHGASESRNGHEEGRSHYLRFAAMILASFAAMYVLMYAMVNAVENALPNNNQLYMAGLMAAAMAIVELAIMGGMYPNKKLTLAIVGVSILALAGFWFGLRGQVAISDRQFLKSMIPHHAGAILMCSEAAIQDVEIAQLCKSIVSSQQTEIDQMRTILERLEQR
ncbi:MAG: DUF305 domain-containing protein [Thermoanaerobaculia bacterium]|nr:DUF305 domain-containing protein [Thermoanaerobaculia bacterium]